MRFLILTLFLGFAAFGAQAAQLNVPQSGDAAAASDTLPPPPPPVMDAPEPPPPAEQPTDQPADLSPQDVNDLARIQDYLNELKSIAADFLQIDDRGQIMRGTIAIERPGKMRVTYAPPSKDFIVADGSFVHIWDGSLKSQTNVPEGSSLANFILRDHIVLNGDVTVTKFQRFPAKLEVTLVQTKDPGAGQLTLVFEDHPLLLRQWRVLDAQGRTTGVNLENERMDVQFDRDTFSFVPPGFGKGGKAQ